MQCNFSNTRYFGKKCIVVILTREKVGKCFNLISVSLSLSLMLQRCSWKIKLKRKFKNNFYFHVVYYYDSAKNCSSIERVLAKISVEKHSTFKSVS